MKPLQKMIDGDSASPSVAQTSIEVSWSEMSVAPSVRISLLLYGAELSVTAILLSLYKKVGRPFSTFLPTPAGRTFIVGVCVLIAVVGLMLYSLRARELRRQFLPTLALNLGVLVLLFSTAEVTIRALVTLSPAGPVFGATVLLPKSWTREAAENRAVLKEATVRASYLVSDKDLGWAIRPSARNSDYNLRFEIEYLERLRRAAHDGSEPVRLRPNMSASDDSVYLSSAEGIRSPRAGMSFASTRPLHRIALIGDSFTFGLEVRYEQTWGHQLEIALGRDYQVLNFGVDAYGVDQAFLRYQRDVVSWHPEVVILGVVSDDLYRTMCVYAFLCFPGSQIPFSKPRFVLEGDSLRLLKPPAEPPESIFAKPSIDDLPLIQYDRAFDPLEWEWHSYDFAYSIRLLLSKYRRWSVPGTAVDNAALEGINGALFHSFLSVARANGATPVVLFFPTRAELSPSWTGGPYKGREVLRKAGIPFVDMTPCLTSLEPAQRFIVLHYSAPANAAVARCVRRSLPQLVAHGMATPSVAR